MLLLFITIPAMMILLWIMPGKRLKLIGSIIERCIKAAKGADKTPP